MLINSLTKNKTPIKKACNKIPIPIMFSDGPEIILDFDVSPDMYDSIELWVHEFTEAILYSLIMKYTGMDTREYWKMVYLCKKNSVQLS